MIESAKFTYYILGEPLIKAAKIIKGQGKKQVEVLQVLNHNGQQLITKK